MLEEVSDSVLKHNLSMAYLVKYLIVLKSKNQLRHA